MKNKTFELFFGTGGVGKTTISCARAIALCQQGQRVLLMTIDPAKRLKEVLGLSGQSSGEIIRLSCLPGFSPWSGSLDVLLMDPEKTIQNMKYFFRYTVYQYLSIVRISIRIGYSFIIIIIHISWISLCRFFRLNDICCWNPLHCVMIHVYE